MEKISYTKDELKFIDNCAHCIATSDVFNNDVGHILTINGVKGGIHKDISKESCKDYLFKLDLDEFDSIRFKFEQVITESMRVKSRLLELLEMFNGLRNND